MTDRRRSVRPVLPMAVLLVVTPVAGRAQESGKDPGQAAAGRRLVIRPRVKTPVAESVSEPWNDFADPVPDIDRTIVEHT